MADEKQTTADETVEYEYVEAPDDGIEYEYIEVPEGTEPETTDETASADNIEYEYIEVPEEEAAPAPEPAAPEAPAAETSEEVEYEYVEVPEEEAAPAPEAPAAEATEEVEYEYVEVPEEEAAPAPEPAVPEAPAAEATEEVEYEYVEVPEEEAAPAPEPAAPEAPAAEASEEVEYEYVEVPEEEAASASEPAAVPEAPAAEATEEVEYEYVEVPEEDAAPAPKAPAAGANEEVEYEYVEVPEEEAAPAPEAPAAEASEEVEYEYVEVPEEEAAPAPEAPAAEAAQAQTKEDENLSAQKEEPAKEMSGIDPLSAEDADLPLDDEPPLPPDDEGPSTDILMEPEASVPVDSEMPLPPDEDEAFPVANIADPVDKSLLENEEALAEELEVPADDTEDNAVQETTTPSSVSAKELEDIDESEPVETPEEKETSAGIGENNDDQDVADAPIPVVSDNAAEEIDAYAAKAAQELEQEAEESNEPNPPVTDEETQEELDPKDEDDTLLAADRFVFDGNSGLSSFVGSAQKDTVVLNRDSGNFNSLADWHLIINELTVIPLNSQNEEELPLSEDIFCQGCIVSEGTEISSFANASSAKVPAPQNGNQRSAVISGINIISLAGRDGTVIDLDASNGILIGPDDAKLYFSGLNRLVIPKPAEPTPPAYVIPETEDNPKAFVYTQAQAAAAEQSETQNEIIVIKTGYNLYGWNVTFENGTTMSLADVRSYQSKHHSLPDKNGVISYGKSTLRFTGADRIIAYEKPSYCAYGLSPAV